MSDSKGQTRDTPPPGPGAHGPAAARSRWAELRRRREQRLQLTARRPAPLCGGNRVHLLSGGDELFPAMHRAISAARRQIWLATYIFHDDEASRLLAQALADAARRGVWVGVVVDGFGSKGSLPRVRDWLADSGVNLAVFRPVDRWWRLLQPGQMRRLHQKLCVVDGDEAFVGGINLIDDRFDLNHGWFDPPRLDFAVQVHGPVVQQAEQTVRAVWSRAALGADWREEVRQLALGAEPVARARRLMARLRMPAESIQRALAQAEADDAALATMAPMRAVLLVRDNFRQRRMIEHAYVDAIAKARHRVDIVCPYFYPGRVFRRVLLRAARRGVTVRLLLQGKPDYRFAVLAARVLYDELRGAGVQVFEYTRTYLHAKVAVVDDDWATVGSSNIDPLSLLLNLEANVVVRDQGFAAQVTRHIEAALSDSHRVGERESGRRWMGGLSRGFVAWVAYWFLRLSGNSGRY